MAGYHTSGKPVAGLVTKVKREMKVKKERKMKQEMTVNKEMVVDSLTPMEFCQDCKCT